MPAPWDAIGYGVSLTRAGIFRIGVPVADGVDDNPLMVEIMAEKASAYFGRVRKLQAALAALTVFDQDRTSPEQARKTQRDELVAEAAEQAWYFVIQREAMKLPHYEELFADFDIPDEVKLKMGPKR